nr:MAG TPA: hypothetical protein [Caudoviricetes sp.]
MVSVKNKLSSILTILYLLQVENLLTIKLKEILGGYRVPRCR